MDCAGKTVGFQRWVQVPDLLLMNALKVDWISSAYNQQAEDVHVADLDLVAPWSIALQLHGHPIDTIVLCCILNSLRLLMLFICAVHSSGNHQSWHGLMYKV